jgi:hypothetical protein
LICKSKNFGGNAIHKHQKLENATDHNTTARTQNFQLPLMRVAVDGNILAGENGEKIGLLIDLF